MNTRQLRVLWIGIGVACLLLLFPPQVMMPAMPSLVSVLQNQLSGAPQPLPAPAIRYAFLFAPPAGSAGIDWARLLVPVAVVALLMLGAILTLQTRPARLVQEA